MTRFAPYSLTTASFVLASLVLAYEPVRWLIGTWFDPSYTSSGALYLVVILALLAWSLGSAVTGPETRHRQTAIILLLVSGFIRFLSQVLAINVIGGLALALDVYALSVLLRTGSRARPVSPIWLSILFLFTLPVERIIQRIVGYPLQEISANLTCWGLGLIFPDVQCSGIRIELAGKDVLVDLPCSGTSGLMLAMAFIVVLNALFRPGILVSAFWIALTMSLSLLANALRIGALAIGLSHPEHVFGLNVMAQPLHDIIGYVALGLSLLPVLAFYKPRRVNRSTGTTGWFAWSPSRPVQHLSALVFLALALVIVTLPRNALDVSAATQPQILPLSLGGEFGVDEDLLPVEQRYFEQYGGHAQKRRYGALALTLVQTTSPLRHLHAPDDCLRGLGYDVEFLGTRFAPVPTALYRARSETGEEWRVAVTFTSSTGETTHNIAEAIWLWLQNPGARWTSIQRITPWNLPDSHLETFEAAAIAALDLRTTISSKTISREG
ncbi:exosortase/archaeosortase family protein [Labrenzia sp. EL_195]|nr:exosortase/archaeosortase family protein [Labrenzia sp. EL_195]